MWPSLRIFLQPALLLGFCLSCCAADIEFQPASPDELKMTSEPMAPGAPAIILFRQVDRDDRASNSAREDNYVRIKILSEEGRKFGDVEIPFWEGAERIVDIKARTLNPDGAIINFDGKVFDKRLVKARGVRYSARTFVLPDVQVGSVIEYSYRTEWRWVYDSSWILSQDLFTKKARFSLRPNPFFTVRVGGRVPAGLQPKMGSDRVIRLEASDIPAFQKEDFMPPEGELRARVDFIYGSTRFETDTDKFWKNVGKDWNEDLDHFVAKRKTMEDAVTQVVAPQDASEVKLRKLYDRVLQIRNTSYELEKTRQEEKRAKEKTVENVEDVWKRGYGSATQITWLYLALVRAAGFEAYGCWVADREHYFFNPKTEETEKLDTNVVLLKLGGHDLYFDPGAAFTPYGLLPWTETKTAGLCLDKNGGFWIETPLPASSDSTIEYQAKLKLSPAGDLEGTLRVAYSGLEAMDWRLNELHTDDVERKRALEDYVKEHISGPADVGLANKPDWRSTGPPLVAEFDLKIPGWTSGAGKRAVFPVGIFTASEKHLFENGERTNPIYFAYPFGRVDNVTIELPADWNVNSIPENEDRDGHAVRYSFKVENQQNSLHLIRKLNVDVFMLGVNQYANLRNFFQIVRTADDQQIILQPATTAASN